jgi:hypothetical protein
MPQIAPGASNSFRLPAEQVLTASGSGKVHWLAHSADIPAGGTLNVGPFRHPLTIIIRAGDEGATYSLPDPLTTQIERGTEFVRSARIIQSALIERNQMAKGARLPTFAAIGIAMDKLTDSLEHRAQRIMNRVEGTEARGAAVEQMANAHLDATDAQLKEYGQYFDAVETAIGGNGAPLADSEKQSG